MKIDVLDTEGNERYKVRHPTEIERILRGIVHERALVTAYGNNETDFLVTTLLGVDTRERVMYLDCGGDERLNARLLGSPQVTFSCTHDHVKVQFSSQRLERVMLDGAPAFRARLPGELLRFQRREYYRLLTSITNPVKCQIPFGESQMEATVIDISLGGVGLLAFPNGKTVKVGESYHNCHLTLPDSGTYPVSMCIRATFDVTLKNGTRSRRVGCQFIDLPSSVETEIQRYIIRVERERRL